MPTVVIIFIVKRFAFIELNSGSTTTVSIRLLQGKICNLFKKWILQSYNIINDFQLAFRLLGGTDVYVIRTVILPVIAKGVNSVINSLKSSSSCGAKYILTESYVHWNVHHLDS